MSESARVSVSGTHVPIAVIVLTFDEAKNIETCLRSVVGWTSEVFVVDSGSRDNTRELAEACGASVVTHPFETHARQWTWALANLPLTMSWVLAIDADQSVTPKLRTALEDRFRNVPETTVGFYLNRRQIFRGRWIRFGGYYPKYLLKLFRRDAVRIDEKELVDHHFAVTGRTEKLAGDLIEDNRNEADISVWIAKHNRYASLQARQELDERRASPGASAIFETPDSRVRWLKARWAKLPLFVRPCLYFVYRYFLRLGFLDGREGFIFHVLQAFWYRLLVDINISEIRDATRRAMVAQPGVTAVGSDQQPHEHSRDQRVSR